MSIDHCIDETCIREPGHGGPHVRRWLTGREANEALDVLERMRRAYERGASADDLVRLIDAALSAASSPSTEEPPDG